MRVKKKTRSPHKAAWGKGLSEVCQVSNFKKRSSKKGISYTPALVFQVAYLAVKRGRLTNRILAESIGCNERTIILWKGRHKEFKEITRDAYKSVLGEFCKKVFDNMIYGTVTKYYNSEGDLLRSVHQSPTDRDLLLPVRLGMIKTDQFAVNCERERLKKEASQMRHYIDKYRSDEISISELLLEFYYRAIPVPSFLMLEYSHKLKIGTIETIKEEDTYNQAHAMQILEAKKEREEARIHQAIEAGIKERLKQIETDQN